MRYRVDLNSMQILKKKNNKKGTKMKPTHWLFGGCIKQTKKFRLDAFNFCME